MMGLYGRFKRDREPQRDKKPDSACEAAGVQPSAPPQGGTGVVAAVMKHSCGHPIPVKHFQHAKCGACRNLDRMAKNSKRRAAQAAKVEANTDPHAKSSRHVGRLPHGAAFQCVYDASNQEWSGILTIGHDKFTAMASGLFRLQSMLDEMFRKHCENTADN